MAPALLAVVLAFASDLVDWRGLVALLVVAAACIAAHRAPGKSARLVAHAVVVVLCAGFFLHVVPGFNNPRVIDAVLIGEGTSSYSKYLNFDKGMAGVLLLGLYVPERVRNDEGVHRFTAFAWRFAIMVGALATVAMASGYARWDPKLPHWWALWVWSMLVLTALPEEAVFRGRPPGADRQVCAGFAVACDHHCRSAVRSGSRCRWIALRPRRFTRGCWVRLDLRVDALHCVGNHRSRRAERDSLLYLYLPLIEGEPS